MKLIVKIMGILALFYLPQHVKAQTTNSQYDSTLAKKCEADDYGMKVYTLVILKTGSNSTASKTFRDSCFAGHMQNIKRLVDAGDLIVAGPFLKNDAAFRGIFILNTKTLEEAKTILDTDPAIQENLLAPEMYLWYGSAALPEYLPASEKVWKKGF